MSQERMSSSDTQEKYFEGKKLAYCQAFALAHWKALGVGVYYQSLRRRLVDEEEIENYKTGLKEGELEKFERGLSEEKRDWLMKEPDKRERGLLQMHYWDKEVWRNVSQHRQAAGFFGGILCRELGVDQKTTNVVEEALCIHDFDKKEESRRQKEQVGPGKMTVWEMINQLEKDAANFFERKRFFCRSYCFNGTE